MPDTSIHRLDASGRRISVYGDQEDPLSLHRYHYCEGNPVNNADPSGYGLDSMPDISSSIFARLVFTIALAASSEGGYVPVADVPVNNVGALIAAKARQNLHSKNWLYTKKVGNS